MLKNYLLIALRNSWKNKTYSGINIFGLAVSLAVALLMLLWVKDELSVDRFHDKGEAIQRIFMVYPQEGGKNIANGNVAYPFLQQIETEVPEVEEVMYFGYPSEQLVTREKLSYKEIGMYSNSSLFKTFSFPVVQGEIDQIDQALNGIAISQSMAKRFFGRDWDKEALGETIRVNDKDDFVVEAIFADVPKQSSLQFDFVMNVLHRIKNNDWLKDWGNKGMGGIILLREDASAALAREKIDALYRKSEVFEEGEYVDVTGTSKGKGFQGVVKRHGFGGVGQATHGQHNRMRAPGSIGAASDPARVFKGMRMAGQMGNKRITVTNLKVLKVLTEKNLVVVKGSVPGPKGSIVLINK